MKLECCGLGLLVPKPQSHRREESSSGLGCWVRYSSVASCTGERGDKKERGRRKEEEERERER